MKVGRLSGSLLYIRALHETGYIRAQITLNVFEKIDYGIDVFVHLIQFLFLNIFAFGILFCLP